MDTIIPITDLTDINANEIALLILHELVDRRRAHHWRARLRTLRRRRRRLAPYHLGPWAASVGLLTRALAAHEISGDNLCETLTWRPIEPERARSCIFTPTMVCVPEDGIQPSVERQEWQIIAALAPAYDTLTFRLGMGLLSMTSVTPNHYAQWRYRQWVKDAVGAHLVAGWSAFMQQLAALPVPPDYDPNRWHWVTDGSVEARREFYRRSHVHGGDDVNCQHDLWRAGLWQDTRRTAIAVRLHVRVARQRGGVTS